MVRASILLEGVTAPVTRGRSSQERRNRASSSKRSFGWILRGECRWKAWSTVDPLGRLAVTDVPNLDKRRQARVDPPKPSKNSRTREKKPALSGWVSRDDS